VLVELLPVVYEVLDAVLVLELLRVLVELELELELELEPVLEVEVELVLPVVDEELELGVVVGTELVVVTTELVVVSTVVVLALVVVATVVVEEVVGTTRLVLASAGESLLVSAKGRAKAEPARATRSKLNEACMMLVGVVC
jgi:hypothetical protein